MNLTERFLKYVSFDTQSDEASDTTPSTAKQRIFADYLKSELEQLGLEDVYMDENAYVYATLPSNVDYEVPVIGFISHYDTSPDCSGKDVHPRIVHNYDGGDIVLSEADNIISSPKQFPELLAHKGEDLVVTDGHTLLGADDKAGITEIVTAMAYLMAHPEIKHGKIRVGFNPDEEIGLGAHKFDVKRFGCEWAYTVDGGDEGELEYENFNAAAVKVSVKGRSVHPGYAKGKMLNAARIAMEYASLFPKNETPETTEGYQGFYHLMGVNANIEHAELSYIIRDHDRKRFEDRKAFVQSMADAINARYGAEIVSVAIHDQYYNMLEKIKPVMHIIEIAKTAMRNADVPVKVQPIRGGTDGAQLSYKGLPCPNLFTGGVNFHGPYEFASLQVMEKAMHTVVNICCLTAGKYAAK